MPHQIINSLEAIVQIGSEFFYFFTKFNLGSLQESHIFLYQTVFGLFLANSGLSCKVKAFAFNAAATSNVIKCNLA